jgi:hypothetical protein
MAKLNPNPNLPTAGIGQESLIYRLTILVRQIIAYCNQVAEGRLTAFNTYTTAPTAGSWAIGDEVRNSAPAELGTAGNKYVIRGWICTVSGTPGTWVEQRTLTGN